MELIPELGQRKKKMSLETIFDPESESVQRMRRSWPEDTGSSLRGSIGHIWGNVSIKIVITMG